MMNLRRIFDNRIKRILNTKDIAIPIFNALNNRGENAFEEGELDNWGGHFGRGDDYHYHMIPLHLEELVGTNQPLAYGLDGFPIYGLTDNDLDQAFGRFDENGSYRSVSYTHLTLPTNREV